MLLSPFSFLSLGTNGGNDNYYRHDSAGGDEVAEVADEADEAVHTEAEMVDSRMNIDGTSNRVGEEEGQDLDDMKVVDKMYSEEVDNVEQFGVDGVGMIVEEDENIVSDGLLIADDDEMMVVHESKMTEQQRRSSQVNLEEMVEKEEEEKQMNPPFFRTSQIDYHPMHYQQPKIKKKK